MCNTAYNLKTVFSCLVFLNFGLTFVVTACTHNMSLKSGGCFSPPIAYTLVWSSKSEEFYLETYLRYTVL